MNCLITGVSRGIGNATMNELLWQGHVVWGLSRTLVPAPAAEKKSRFRHSLCDVGDASSRQRVAAEMENAGFWPDCVILNAAIEYEEENTALSWEKMQALFRINIDGALFWISHFIDRSEIRPVQFIGMSSLTAVWPQAEYPAYSASKAALSMAFRALRLRYKDGPASFKLLTLGPVQTSINPRYAARDNVPRIVTTPEKVARYVATRVLTRQRFHFYYPASTAALCRFGRWMPDPFFHHITRPFRR